MARRGVAGYGMTGGAGVRPDPEYRERVFFISLSTSPPMRDALSFMKFFQKLQPVESDSPWDVFMSSSHSADNHPFHFLQARLVRWHTAHYSVAKLGACECGRVVQLRRERTRGKETEGKISAKIMWTAVPPDDRRACST